MEIHTGLPNHTCGGMGVWIPRIITQEDGVEWDDGEMTSDPNCESCQTEQAQEDIAIADMECAAEQANERAWEER